MSPRAVVDEALLLDNQICFLVYRLHRAINDRYRPVLAELGLTYSQYLVMLVLWESSPLSVGDIGARLHLDSGTLSPLLKRLETAGFVNRTRSADDERSVEVSLSASGRALRRSAHRVPLELGECLAGSPEGYAAVRGQLTALLSRMDPESALG